jgi:site-specific recombinase XerD
MAGVGRSPSPARVGLPAAVDGQVGPATRQRLLDDVANLELCPLDHGGSVRPVSADWSPPVRFPPPPVKAPGRTDDYKSMAGAVLHRGADFEKKFQKPPEFFLGNGDILAAFADANRLTASDKQIAANRRNASDFLRRANVRRPADITAAAVEAYLAELRMLGRSAKTILNVKSSLSRFCHYLRRRGLLEHNPCADVECATPEKLPPPVLEGRRIAEFLQSAERQGLRELVLVAITTGLRAGELCRLRWADVDLAGRTLLVRRAKDKSPRVVPLASPAVAALEALHRRRPGFAHVCPARRTFRGGVKWIDRPASYRSILRQLEPVRRGFDEFRQQPAGRVGNAWHLFRHQFATELVDANVDISLISEWMGHSDIRLTKRYARLRRAYHPAIERGFDAIDGSGL